MKTTFKLFALIAVLFSLSACNTIAGMGKDVSKAGDAIERGAEKAKK
jgi:entericidin B